MKVVSDFECFLHKEKHTVDVPEKELKAWHSGSFIQNAMPSVPADDREVLMTGMCSEAWASLGWAEDEDDDENWHDTEWDED